MQYIMIGRTVCKVDDLFMWSSWMEWMSEHNGRHIGRDRILPRKPLKKNKVSTRGPRRASKRSLSIINKNRVTERFISTVFLGVDHSHQIDGRPILFETMIFGGRYNDYQRRYYTIEQAKEGHQRALRLAS